MNYMCIKTVLMFSLMMPLPSVAADIVQDGGIHALDAQLHHSLVYLNNDVRKIIIELKDLLPYRAWSTIFKNICQDIQDEGTVALYQDVDQIVYECQEACNMLPYDQRCSMQLQLEQYKQLLHAGKAYISVCGHDEGDQTLVTRKNKCFLKVCKLCVGCLSVSGHLFVNGVDFSALNAIAGAIGATGPQGIQGIAGVLGAIGAAGPQGAQGIAGVLGAIGATGPQGAQGIAGVLGAVGAAGPQGAQGIAGVIGAIGASGATGAQGEPGIPGVGGILGFAYACNTAAQTVAAGGNVTFNLSASPSAGITPPTPGGDSFTIITAGVYLIQYHVRGTPASLTPPSALEFEVTSGGTPLPCSTYASSVQSTSLAAAGTEAVNGFTIVSLPATAIIKLHNITLSSVDSVGLAAVPVGGTSAVNASMSIIRLV